MVNSSPASRKKVDAVLTGVSETALMTLQVRANEARRPDSIIDDPMAVELVDSVLGDGRVASAVRATQQVGVARAGRGTCDSANSGPDSWP